MLSPSKKPLRASVMKLNAVRGASSTASSIWNVPLSVSTYTCVEYGGDTIGLDAIVAASTVVGAGRMAAAVVRAGSIVWSSDAARTRTAQSLSARAAMSVG